MTIDTQGATFQRGDAASPEVFTTVPGLVNIGEVGVERSLIDTTNLASTIREYKGAIPDGAEIDLDFQYDASTQQVGLKADLDNNTGRQFKINIQDSPVKVFAFAGLVISWKISNPIDQVVPLTVRVKITGSLTIT